MFADSRPSERIMDVLANSQKSPLLLLYGAGLRDHHIGHDYQERSTDESLWLGLRQVGYERVLFHSSHRWVYFLDPESIPKRPEPDLVPPPGPLQESPTITFPRLNQPRTDAIAIEHISDYLNQGRIRSAVVLRDAETLLNFSDVASRRTLAGLFDAWDEPQAGNPNLCIMLFSANNREQLREWIGVSHQHRLYASVEDPQLSRMMGTPGMEELERLVDTLRLREGLGVCWEQRRALIRCMNSENQMLSNWLAKLRKSGLNGGCFDLATARRDGWFGHAELDLRTPMERLDALHGVDPIKKRLRQLKAYAQASQTEGATGLSVAKPPLLHMVFSGNPGTGKTTVARLVGEILADMGLLSRGHTVAPTMSELVAPYLGQTAGRTNAKIDEALDGVLFVDEAYELDPGDRGGEGANAYGSQALAAIMERMSRDGHRLCVIFAGYPERLRKMMKVNPGLSRRFSDFIEFPDFEPNELMRIALEELYTEVGKIPPDDLRLSMRHVLERRHAVRDETFGNVAEAEGLAKRILIRFSERIDRLSLPTDSPLSREDLAPEDEAYLPPSITPQQAVWDELDALVGLEPLKRRLRDFETIALARAQEAAEGKTLSPIPVLHMIFEGNPGVGKTTAARLVARFLANLRLLTRSVVHEPRPSDLMGRHVGEAYHLTDTAVTQALDGVLFIDDAHQLISSRSDNDANAYGRQALTTLMTRMENERHRLCVILASYPGLLQNLTEMDPGIQSRIPAENIIHFPDPTAEDLHAMATRMLSSHQLEIPSEIDAMLHDLSESLESVADESSGGLRTMGQIVLGMESSRQARIRQERLSADSPLTSQDFPEAYRRYLRPQVEAVETILAELDQFVGLASVKQFIRDQINLLRLEQQRQRSSLRISELRHMVFRGNPGTGKTSIANIMGRVFRSLGVLRSGHVISASEAQISASGWNGAARETRRLVRQARGGVLFLDEAYQLADSVYGQTIIAELLQAMTEEQNRLVVIVAGYEHHLERFFSINPGLNRRFAHVIDFPDFSASELTRITVGLCHRNNFTVDDDVLPAMERYFHSRLTSSKGKDIRNAGEAEDLFREMRQKLANRIAAASKRLDDRAMLNRFTLADVPIFRRSVVYRGYRS